MRMRRLNGVACGLAGLDFAVISLALGLAPDGHIYTPGMRLDLWPGLGLALLFFTLGMYLMAWCLIPPEDDKPAESEPRQTD